MKRLESLDINILYLEDDAVVRESVERLLKLVAQNVYTAANGEEGLHYFDDPQIGIDVIIMDLRMPKMDGLSFLEEIRNKGYETPVIVTTAFNELEYLQKAIELKVSKFIHKPIKIQDLMHDVQKFAQVIANQKELERKKLQLENYKQAIHLTNFVIDITPEGDILQISKGLEEYIDSTLDAYIAITHINEVLPQAIADEMLAKVKNYEVYHKDIVLTFQGEKFTMTLTAFGSGIAGSEVEVISLILKDLTHLMKQKDQIISKLYHDITTNLPNRHALIKELNEYEGKLGLIIISIDEFKTYQHTYGYQIADELLSEMANNLQNYWPDARPRQLFKLESSLFAVAMPKMHPFDLNRVRGLAQTMVDHFKTFVIQMADINIDISVTLGTSCIGSTDILVEALIALDSAYAMKKDFICYEELSNPKQIYIQNIHMQQTIKRAFQDDHIVPYFQPIVDQDKKIVKYEALARIIDPDNPSKLLEPQRFLEVVQHSKNYERFTRTIIHKAIQASLQLNAPISINLSYEDIINPSLIEFLEEIFNKNHPHAITLEFLESEGMQDMDKTRNFCQLMKGYGAKIAIDDFGKGYSNYDYFFEIPIDVLKIDGSLVKRVNEYKGYLLLESIITYAQKLNIQVIAEFVEDEAIFNRLKTLNVDMFQGYYFAQPKSVQEILTTKA